MNPTGKKSPVSDLKEPTSTHLAGTHPHPPPPPAGRPAGVLEPICSDRAAKTAGKTKYTPSSGTGTGTCTVPQSILRNQNPGPPRAAAAHSGPAFRPMGERLGIAKRVRFSCEVKIITTQVFNPSPPKEIPHPDPDSLSGSGRPRRSRRKPERLGIDSVEPLSSPLGGEL